GWAAGVGWELYVRRAAPLDDVTGVGGDLFGEAIRRLRAGDVRRTAGFDGEYGVIRLFDPGELGTTGSDALFDLPVTPSAARSRTARPASAPPAARRPSAEAPATDAQRRASADQSERDVPRQAKRQAVPRASKPVQ